MKHQSTRRINLTHTHTNKPPKSCRDVTAARYEPAYLHINLAAEWSCRLTTDLHSNRVYHQTAQFCYCASLCTDTKKKNYFQILTHILAMDSMTTSGLKHTQPLMKHLTVTFSVRVHVMFACAVTPSLPMCFIEFILWHCGFLRNWLKIPIIHTNSNFNNRNKLTS